MAGNLTAMIAAAFAGGGAVTSDPYFEYTTLLLPGNGTNLANNNTFLDSSSNAFTVTRNPLTGPNAPTQGTFSPFSQTGWGNYFDGSSYFTISSSATAAFQFNGNFTWEGWIYPTSFPANKCIYSTMANASTASGIDLGVGSDGKLYVYGAGASFKGYSTNPLTLNQWNHFALVRSGSSCNYYINGVSNGSFSLATNLSDGFCYIGTNNYDSSTRPTCYFSNMRMVKGVAVYTGAFTPPTSPLTATQSAGTNISAITTGQTSLLTCQSNRFVDNGQGNTGNTGFPITVTGSPSVQAFSPFNPTSSWSAATYGGSGYFDGNGDYLTVPDNDAFHLSNQNFTVELWIYINQFSSSGTWFVGPWGNTSSTNRGWDFAYVTGGTGVVFGYSTNGTNATLIQSSSTIQTNTWYHFAAVRNSDTLTIYQNGSAIATGSMSGVTIYNNTTPLYIGRNPEDVVQVFQTNGYISSLRIVKGTAVYTSNFTPPTAPLTNITNTSLLLNFTNAGIYDATSKNDLETVGAASISTAQSKWGGSSMVFNGSTSYLLGPAAKANDFGTGDFTIEAWIYFSSVANGQIASAGGGPVSGAYYWQFYTSQLQFGANTSPGQLIAANWSPSSGVWYHVAVTRSGTTLRQFVNGTQLGTNATSSHSFVDASTQIGYGGAGYFNGYIQDFRTTKGIARYTSNFTAPTAAFPTL